MAAGSFISSSETPPAAGSSGVGGHGETGRFRRLWSLAPVLSWTVLFLFLAEVLVAVVAPALLSDRLYLRAYLGRDARESTIQIAGDLGSYLTWNPVTGWRNRPNSSRKKWQVDEHGARATHAFGQHKEGRRRILFLGDSMTNGGTAVTRDETISAYVEDADTEALNFGTMLFGLDQMLLDYEDRLGAFEADVVVVGLSENAMAGLANRYIPFRRRSETNMPYFKPRFAIESGRLRLIPVPPRDAYERLLTRADLLPELRETDDFYGEFAAFKRCGWLPLSGAAWTDGLPGRGRPVEEGVALRPEVADAVAARKGRRVEEEPCSARSHSRNPTGAAQRFDALSRKTAGHETGPLLPARARGGSPAGRRERFFRMPGGVGRRRLAAGPGAAGRGRLDRLLLTGELAAVRSADLFVPETPLWELQLRFLEEDGAVVKAGDRVAEFDATGLTSDLEQKRIAAIEAETELVRFDADREGAIARPGAGRPRARTTDAREGPHRRRDPRGAPTSRRDHEEKQLALKRAETELDKARGGPRRRTGRRPRRTAPRSSSPSSGPGASATSSRPPSRALTLRAPKDGVFVVAENPRERKKFLTGDTLWPGMTLARIPDLETLRVDALLFDVDDGRIRVGDAGRRRSRHLSRPAAPGPGRVDRPRRPAGRPGLAAHGLPRPRWT